MILGSKPLSEMTVEEMRAAFEELRSKREALRSEAMKKKRNAEIRDEVLPKAPRQQPRVASKEDDALLRFLIGETDTI